MSTSFDDRLCGSDCAPPTVSNNRTTSFENWSEYLDVNDRFSNPVVYPLSSRGFYSEINCLLIAMVYALHKNRRLYVDCSRFGGLDWFDFFETPLPMWTESDRSSVPKVELIDLHKARKLVRIRNNLRIPLRIKHTRQYRSVFSIKSELARLMHQPSFTIPRPPGLAPGSYCAIQIRRGDKVQGYLSRGKMIVEGDDASVEEYAKLLREHADQYDTVFVLTDDYQFFLQLRELESGRHFITLCDESATGYVNDDFQKLDLEAKRSNLRRLVSSVHLAGAAQFFIGPFMSNPSRIVPLLQGTLERSASTDRARKWKAN